jgi:hypothetical protein
MLDGMQKVVQEAELNVPGFFSPERLVAIRAVFDAMVCFINLFQTVQSLQKPFDIFMYLPD